MAWSHLDEGGVVKIEDAPTYLILNRAIVGMNLDEAYGLNCRCLWVVLGTATRVTVSRLTCSP
jgi:hypothetical protein